MFLSRGEERTKYEQERSRLRQRSHEVIKARDLALAKLRIADEEKRAIFASKAKLQSTLTEFVNQHDSDVESQEAKFAAERAELKKELATAHALHSTRERDLQQALEASEARCLKLENNQRASNQAALAEFLALADYDRRLTANTVSILRDFCHDILGDFPRAGGHFSNYVRRCIGENYVIPFEDFVIEEEIVDGGDDDEEEEEDAGPEGPGSSFTSGGSGEGDGEEREEVPSDVEVIE